MTRHAVCLCACARAVFSRVLISGCPAVASHRTCAIIGADACQRYPGASADDILMRLFQENAGRLKECVSWSDWTIILGDIMHREYGYRVFNPMNVDTQVPQIVTPCYPAENTTYDVNQSAMERIRKEFLRAAHVKCGHWDSLWEC